LEEKKLTGKGKRSMCLMNVSNMVKEQNKQYRIQNA